MNLKAWQLASIMFLTPLVVNGLLTLVAFDIVAKRLLSTYEHDISLYGPLETLLLLAIVSNILFAVGGVGFYYGWFGKRLRDLLFSSQALSEGRPLGKPLKGRDEIARLDENLRKMSDTLKELYEKEDAILGYASDVICTFDLAGKCISMNPASSRLWGYEPGELKNTNMFDVIAPADRNLLAGNLRSVSRKSVPGEYELRVTRKDGTLAETLWSLYWSVEHSWVVAVVHDITARKIAERQQAEFVAMVSHDLRAPLGTVQMFLQGFEIGMWGELPESLRESGKKSKKLLDRLVNLTDDILSYEKIDASEATLDMREIQASSVIDDAVHSLSGFALQNKVSVRVEKTSAVIFADRNRLVQALTNFLSNAIKYSPIDSTVDISVSSGATETMFCIRDRGPGISDENKSVIFEKFKQVNSKGTKPGTGLGLAICKQIIERHGGRVGVSDAPDGGSVFWFQIPNLLEPKGE